MKKIFSILLIFFCVFAQAQKTDIVEFEFGKGVTFTSRDSSIQLNFSARMQNRYDGQIRLSEGAKYENRFRVRRARLKFSGFAFTPKLTYKIQISLVKAQVLDAVIKWNFYKGFTLWFGQTNLPGDRDQLISSKKLQFVDRSLLNSKFTLDRDKGIQIHHQHAIGKVVMREMVSIAMGEGLNHTSFERGNEYTARVEILPLGNFIKGGEYIGGDMYREPTPKLAIAGAFDFNHHSKRVNGTHGEFLDGTKNLKTFFADFIFKYEGFSAMGGFAHRSTIGSPVVVESMSPDSIQSFYTGWGINAQCGYWFKKNWEVAGRVIHISPERQTPYPELTEYALVVSKYIVGHSLKVQTDISFLKEESEDPTLIFRLQAELSF